MEHTFVCNLLPKMRIGRVAADHERGHSAGITAPCGRCRCCPKGEIMIRTSLLLTIIGAAVAAIPFVQPAAGQEETDQRLGTVHFPTSCNEVAQRRFDRGMRYQHSFATSPAGEIFGDVLKADPDCGIAYWGIALSLLDNPYGRPPNEKLALGL